MTEEFTLRLRALEPADVDCLFLWENTPGMWRCGFAPAPLSRHRIWQYINEYDPDPFSAGQLRLMVEADGRAVGAVDLYDVDALNRHAKVGIMIEERHRGRGLGRSALQALARYCFDVLGLYQLLAVVESDNDASRGLFLSAGYEECGRIGEWFRRGNSYSDAVIYRRLLS